MPENNTNQVKMGKTSEYAKTLDDTRKAHGEALQSIQNDMLMFFNHLLVNSELFNAEETFKALKDYIRKNDRILYSVVTATVYQSIENDLKKDIIEINPLKNNSFGTLLTNMSSLLDYSETPSNINTQKADCTNDNEREAVDKAKVAVKKILDHMELGHSQYLEIHHPEKTMTSRMEKELEKA